MTTLVPDADTLFSVVRLHLIPERCRAVTMQFLKGRYLGLRLASPEGDAPTGRVSATLFKPTSGPLGVVFDMTLGEQNLVEILFEGERTNASQPFLQLKLKADDGDCIVRIFVPGYTSDQRLLKDGQERVYTYPVATPQIDPP